jgi:hypothetical protein
MLISVLVMALAVSLEPFRIGMTVLMLNRPRSMLQLLAFLCGGFAMGIAVGLIVLFAFRRRLLLGSTYFTLPKVQILIGVVALWSLQYWPRESSPGGSARARKSWRRWPNDC